MIGRTLWERYKVLCTSFFLTINISIWQLVYSSFIKYKCQPRTGNDGHNYQQDKKSKL